MGSTLPDDYISTPNTLQNALPAVAMRGVECQFFFPALSAFFEVFANDEKFQLSYALQGSATTHLFLAFPA